MTQAAVCVCVCVTLNSYMIFMYVHTVIQGGQWYLEVMMMTNEMLTVMRTTDIPVAKDSKLTWCEMWEIHVFSIMKEDFIEKDKDRSKTGG